MGIAENIKHLRTQADYTQEQLAEKIGVTRATVTQWETGWSKPRMGAVEKLAEVFNVPLSAIVDGPARASLFPEGVIRPVRDATAWAPIRGRVHAGKPAEPEEVEELAALPATILDAHPSAYFLQVEGDCMDKVYPEGCLILVDPEREPSNGSIAAVSIDGRDAVMRRLLRTPSTMVLSPESFNGEHEDIIITADSGHTVQLIGTVVWFQASKEME